MSDWEADLARQRRSFEEPSIEAARAQPDRSKPETDPKLQMGDRGLTTAILLAAAAGVAVIALGYLAVDLLVEVSDRAITPAQQFTAAFALATALGALVALVVNVRKQNLAEQLARREITVAFTERFRSAAQQLGGASPAERLAGVYAMAALADEYPTRRQQCVDVLCGYLRLPFDPATDDLADGSTTTTHVSSDGRTHTTHQGRASRPFDQQVRETIVSVIREHTHPDSSQSWSYLSFDLTGAHLSNLVLSGSLFLGETRFDGAIFSGQDALLDGTTFSGKATFRKAIFSGETRFDGAIFSGETRFDDANFLGQVTSFDSANFSGERTWFGAAIFSSPMTLFSRATFSGEDTDFSLATFSGLFTWFDKVTFSGQTTSFSEVTFSGQTTSFEGAIFSGGRTSFDKAVIEDGAQVRGLDDPTLVNDAKITRDGEPFRG